MKRTRRVSLIITGRVQGVFYRREALREGIRNGLSGFVVNRADGSVRAEAEGTETAVGAFINWCRRGPEHARVEHVAIRELAPRGDEGFVIRDRDPEDGHEDAFRGA